MLVLRTLLESTLGWFGHLVRGRNQGGYGHQVTDTIVASGSTFHFRASNVVLAQLLLLLQLQNRSNRRGSRSTTISRCLGTVASGHARFGKGVHGDKQGEEWKVDRSSSDENVEWRRLRGDKDTAIKMGLLINLFGSIVAV